MSLNRHPDEPSRVNYVSKSKPALWQHTGVGSPQALAMRLFSQRSIGPAAQPSASSPAELIEVEDICEIDPVLRTRAAAADGDNDDEINVELDAREMDALLDGVLKPD